MSSTCASASGASGIRVWFPTAISTSWRAISSQPGAGTGKLRSIQPTIVIYVEIWRGGFEVGKMDGEDCFHSRGSDRHPDRTQAWIMGKQT